MTTTPALADVIAKLDEAGGFGDGIDFGSFRPLDALNDANLSAEDREAASLVLLSELAEAIDNTTWREAAGSALGRGLKQFLAANGQATHERAVRAFFSSESEFFAELNSVYAQTVGK
jgi:hypothetical protein